MIAYVRAVMAAWADAIADVVAPADPAVRAAMARRDVPAAGVEAHDSAGGGHPVDTTSELLGYDGFKRQNISALALIKDRYGERIDEARLIERLSKSGIVALNQQAKAMKEATGNPADQCYAHAMIQFYNQRNAHRVDPWWNLSVVGVA